MNKEFKKISSKNETRYVLESATAVATSAGAIATAPSQIKMLQKRLAELKDKVSVPVAKPRNPVGMGSTQGRGTQKHQTTDRKKGRDEKKFQGGESVNVAEDEYDYYRDYKAGLISKDEYDSLVRRFQGRYNQPVSRPTYSKPRGMYFYNVKPGQENDARVAGLKQSKSGKWYSTYQNPSADKVFGPGRYWEPKNEDAAEGSLKEDEYDKYENGQMSQEDAVAAMFTRLARQGRDPLDMIAHRFGWSTYELDDLAQQRGFKNAAAWLNSFNQGVAEGSVDRSQNRLWQMISDYEQRAKATKNDIKKAHYLKMAQELRYKLKTSDEQGVAEGQMKDLLWSEAEKLDLEEFLSKHANHPTDIEWLTDFWENVHGVDEDAGISKDKETAFHSKLDKLVHNTFGKRKGEMESHGETDHEVSMASNELQSIAKDAAELLDLVRQRSEEEGLMAWQQSKITKAADYMNSVLQSIGGEQETFEGLRDPKDNPCWKGYKPVGTKKKNGKTVPNCVPTNEDAYIENLFKALESRIKK